MIRLALTRAAASLVAAFLMNAPCAFAQQAYSFNVLRQRSIALTAQFWNPILTHVSRKSGVPLKQVHSPLKSGPDIDEAIAFDFVFTNILFTPSRDRLGYRVIARPAGPGLRSQIIVPKDSPIRTLQDLAGKEVALGRADSFAGYWLPMDALLRARVQIHGVPVDNPYAAYTQLQSGKVAAAGIEGRAMAGIGRREPFGYRAIWTSDPYPDLCIMAHPRVPQDKVSAVRNAFIAMAADPEGRMILEACAELLKFEDGLSFVAAEDGDYEGYRKFFRTTQVQ